MTTGRSPDFVHYNLGLWGLAPPGGAPILGWKLVALSEAFSPSLNIEVSHNIILKTRRRRLLRENATHCGHWTKGLFHNASYRSGRHNFRQIFLTQSLTTRR